MFMDSDKVGSRIRITLIAGGHVFKATRYLETLQEVDNRQSAERLESSACREIHRLPKEVGYLCD